MKSVTKRPSHARNLKNNDHVVMWSRGASTCFIMDNVLVLLILTLSLLSVWCFASGRSKRSVDMRTVWW